MWRGLGHVASSKRRVAIMNLPKIDVTALPDLDTVTGVFGSLMHPVQAMASDDTLIILMVFIYDAIRH